MIGARKLSRAGRPPVFEMQLIGINETPRGQHACYLDKDGRHHTVPLCMMGKAERDAFRQQSETAGFESRTGKKGVAMTTEETISGETPLAHRVYDPESHVVTLWDSEHGKYIRFRAEDILAAADLVRGEDAASGEAVRDLLVPVMDRNASGVDRVTRMTEAGVLSPNEARAMLGLPAHADRKEG